MLFEAADSHFTLPGCFKKNLLSLEENFFPFSALLWNIIEVSDLLQIGFLSTWFPLRYLRTVSNLGKIICVVQITFFPEPFKNNLPTWCSIIPMYFSICILQTITFSYVTPIKSRNSCCYITTVCPQPIQVVPIKLRLVVSIKSFIEKWSSSESRMVISCYVFLVSFIMEQFLSLFLASMTLKLVKICNPINL